MSSHRTFKTGLTALILLIITAVVILFLPWFWRMIYPLPYRDTVFREAQAVDVDPYLIMAVIRVESKFRPKARSVKGAKGLMQLMPETAEWVAAQRGQEFDEDSLFEIDYNVAIGSWYLARLIGDFEGNLSLALAAYNGGPGNVKLWLKQGIWDGELANLGNIPFMETREFVERVLKDYDTYRRIYGWYSLFTEKGGFWGRVTNMTFEMTHSCEVEFVEK